MKQKLKNIRHNLKHNPEFQAKLNELKPKKTVWGFLGVVLLFFVPEVVNFLYSQEINSWMVEVMSLYPPEWADKAIWITQKLFDGELSFLNIGLGFAFLWWLYK
jgi:CDP-diglyceride synthetase